MKHRALPPFLALVCVLGLLSCQQPNPPIVGQRVTWWNGFGEPGDDTVKVVVAGKAEHPGVYHFRRGQTLAGACDLAGVAQGGYGQIEPVFDLFRADGTMWRYDSSKNLKARRQMATMELREGDRLYVGEYTY